MPRLNLPKPRVVEVNASLWKRTFAFLIDLFIILFFLLSPFGSLFDNASPFSMQVTPMVEAAAIIMAFMIWLYFTLFEYLLHQTPGMMLTKLYQKGSSSIFLIGLRNCFVLPFFPFIILWIVEPIHLFRKGLRWLEKITGTATVERGVL